MNYIAKIKKFYCLKGLGQDPLQRRIQSKDKYTLLYPQNKLYYFNTSIKYIKRV